MLDTTLAADRRESISELSGHESAVRPLPDDGGAGLEANSERNLMDAVARALRATGHPALRGVEIEICRGVVVLWGRVPNYYLKQLAQEAAQRVAGVLGIANGLEVVCCR